MSQAEAFELIGENLVLGAVDFYGGLNPDPWMDADELLNNQMLHPELYGQPNYSEYAQIKLALLSQFKRLSSPKNRISVRDAFHLGLKEGAYEAAVSRVNKFCRACEKKEKLGIYKMTGSNTVTELLCRSCAIVENKIMN